MVWDVVWGHNLAFITVHETECHMECVRSTDQKDVKRGLRCYRAITSLHESIGWEPSEFTTQHSTLAAPKHANAHRSQPPCTSLLRDKARVLTSH